MNEENTTLPEVDEVENVETEVEAGNEDINQEAEQPAQQTFKVKHLKGDKEITYDEAIELSQKGLDYDRIREKYDSSKPVLSFVEKMAKQNNMTVTEYMEAVDKYEREQEIEDLASTNQLSKEMAEELYLLRQERKERAKKDEEAKAEQEKKQEYLDFVKEFPSLDLESIPEEVFTIKQNNPRLSLTDAYIRHQWNEGNKKQTIEEANRKNAETSTGSISNDGGAVPDTLTMEMVENMSPSELNKRWAEVKKLYKMK